MKKLLHIIPILSCLFIGTGNVFPGTGSNDNGIGATAWTSPGNILADENTLASCSLRYKFSKICETTT